MSHRFCTVKLFLQGYVKNMHYRTSGENPKSGKKMRMACKVLLRIVNSSLYTWLPITKFQKNLQDIVCTRILTVLSLEGGVMNDTKWTRCSWSIWQTTIPEQNFNVFYRGFSTKMKNAFIMSRNGFLCCRLEASKQTNKWIKTNE